MDIDKHMRAIRKYLKEEKHLTKVDEMTLELLRSDLETLEMIKKQLDVNNGGSMTAKDQYGRTIPSPFLREKDRVIKRVLEYEKKLGLSPYDRKKLEVESSDEKSPLEQFIDSKVNDDPYNLPNQLDLFDVDSL